MTDLGNLKGFELNREAHKFDDVDKSREAHHHTIGEGENQAASGAVLKSVEERVEVLETDEIEWTEVTSFLNSWVNFDAPSSVDRALKFGKRGNDGFIIGVIKNGTNADIFVLPVEYRPQTTNQGFACPNNGSTSLVLVEADGSVNHSSLNGGTNAFVFINIRYRIDA